MINPYLLYQREKKIQKTVGVSSSLYTMNLAALTTYQDPSNEPQIIVQPSGIITSIPAELYWNQMSDRAKPSLYKDKKGVDIKHNYYDRYLNRIKGKLLRRGIINQEIQYSGGKVIKMGVIDCHCAKDNTEFENTYFNPIEHVQQQIYNVGDTVYVPSKKQQGIIIQENIKSDWYFPTYKVQLSSTGEIIYLSYTQITSNLVPECKLVDKILNNTYACTIQSNQYIDR